MITEIVTFDLPKDLTRAEILRKYQSTAAGWSQNPDLIRKYYFLDEAQNKGGGVNVWNSHQAARRWHGDAYKARIKQLYGSEPVIALFDALLEVDNVTRIITEV